MERLGLRSTIGRIDWTPPIRERRFWVVQLLVMLVAFIHLAAHLGWPVPTFGMPHFATMALFMIPMAYAALVYGLGGAVATSAWVILLMSPDLVMHTPADRWANSVQLTSILAASLLVGYQVEVERFLRRKTEEARTRYRELFETNRSPILVVGADGVVQEANPAAVDSLGAARGSKLADLVGAGAGADILRGRPPDLVVLSRGGVERNLHPAVTNLQEEDGASVQIVFVDVTRERQEQKRMQEFAAYVIRGQEEERQRLSQELHDDPMQTMLSLSRRLDKSTAQSMPKELADSLDEGRRIALEAAGGVRRLSKELRPWSLEDLGLPAALRQLTAEFHERTGTGVGFSVLGVPRRLDSAIELALFRVAEEALRNVERHAGASHTKVTLKFESRRALLTVGDDGAGFSVEEGPGPLTGSLGLFGMQERCAVLGGEARVRSKPGGGTTVRAVIPIHPRGPRAG